MAQTLRKMAVATIRNNHLESTSVPIARRRTRNIKPGTGLVEDWERDLLAVIANAQEKAYVNENRDRLANLENYLSRLLILRKLWRAFQASPGHKIDGPHGVAEQMGVSRNGVYCLLQMVRFDPHDFIEQATFCDLVCRSQGLKRWAEGVPEIHQVLRSAKKRK